MATKWCSVSYQALDGIQHTVTLEAESLYEAVAAAVAVFRRQSFLDLQPASNTEFRVEVAPEPKVEHKIRFGQVTQWAQNSVAKGPAEILKREKVRRLLAGKAREGPI